MPALNSKETIRPLTAFSSFHAAWMALMLSLSLSHST